MSTGNLGVGGGGEAPVTAKKSPLFDENAFESPRGRTGNRTVTQMRHPLLVEGRPDCARQSLASTLLAPRVAATSYCDPSRHANVITPCLLTPCLNVPKNYRVRGQRKHINVFNINFLASTQNTPFGPPEKSLCASFLGGQFATLCLFHAYRGGGAFTAKKSPLFDENALEAFSGPQGPRDSCKWPAGSQ